MLCRDMLLAQVLLVSCFTHNVRHGVGGFASHKLSRSPSTSVVSKRLPDKRLASTSQLCDSSSKQKSGYIDLDGTDKHMFYWFFESRRKPLEDPLIMWLNGGPGCSSMIAVLRENGPCSIDKDGKAQVNPLSWTSIANMLWVDQPVGVGFSYQDSDTSADGNGKTWNEEDVAADMLQFLHQWMRENPSYKALDFYLMGESYAGHYIPNLSYQIYRSNKRAEDPLINLKGVALGNSMTDPFVQFHFFAKMVWGNSYGVKGISPVLFKTMLGNSKECFLAIQQCQDDTTKCTNARTLCTSVFFSPYVNAGKDIYDVREPHCNVLPYCYDFRAAKAWYRKPEVRRALGVRPQSLEWAVCNFGVNSDFDSDWMKDFADRIPPLLDAGVKVLVYAGDADYICNWMGNKAWTLDLEWPGKKEFNDASDQKWFNKTDGKKLGEVRTARDLTFVRVYDCGHMVPLEKPNVALEMINKWVSNTHIVPPQLPPPSASLSGVDALLAALQAQATAASPSTKSTSAP